MTNIIKWTVGGGAGLLLTLGSLAVFYPEKTAEAKQSIEATGAVAVDKIIASMEERVGKTRVALEHYKTAYKAKRESLVQLKTLHSEAKRKAAEAAIKAAELRAGGKEASAVAKDAEKAMFEEQAAKLADSSAEASYKEFDLFFKRKKVELDTLSAKTEMLKGELTALSGGDAGFAMQRARELEEEVKKTCSRLDAELQVQQLDNDME